MREKLLRKEHTKERRKKSPDRSGGKAWTTTFAIAIHYTNIIKG